MVKQGLTDTDPEVAQNAAREAERELFLSYAPPDRRAALAASLAIDRALGDVLRQTHEPMLVQMRYTWWHDTLSALDVKPPPAMPLLEEFAREALPYGVGGAALATLVEGWEALIEGDPADSAVRRAFGTFRGDRLFELMGRLLGDDRFDALGDAGRGWALADLSRGLTDTGAAQLARDEAAAALDQALARPWPRPLRALGALAHQARMDLRVPLAAPLPGATPRRIARFAWHRLTGR